MDIGILIVAEIVARETWLYINLVFFGGKEQDGSYSHHSVKEENAKMQQVFW